MVGLEETAVPVVYNKPAASCGGPAMLVGQHLIPGITPLPWLIPYRWPERNTISLTAKLLDSFHCCAKHEYLHEIIKRNAEITHPFLFHAFLEHEKQASLWPHSFPLTSPSPFFTNMLLILDKVV